MVWEENLTQKSFLEPTDFVFLEHDVFKVTQISQMTQIFPSSTSYPQMRPIRSDYADLSCDSLISMPQQGISAKSASSQTEQVKNLRHI